MERGKQNLSCGSLILWSKSSELSINTILQLRDKVSGGREEKSAL
jgi:hypothetical protein